LARFLRRASLLLLSFVSLGGSDCVLWTWGSPGRARRLDTGDPESRRAWPPGRGNEDWTWFGDGGNVCGASRLAERRGDDDMRGERGADGVADLPVAADKDELSRRCRGLEPTPTELDRPLAALCR
jgi:hypothetical protein